MTFARISASLGGSIIALAALILLAVAAAIIFYRYTLPPLPGRTRTVLSVMRASVLIFLLLILFEPVLRIISTTTLPPAIAVLVDNSRSMTISDHGTERSVIAQRTAESLRSLHLPADAVLKYFPFSSKLGPESEGEPDSLTFSGEATDIAATLESVRDRLNGSNIQAVLLISDGNYTTGRNPLDAAEALSIPVFTAGIGDTSDQKDLVVGTIMTNSIAYANTQVPVDASIRSSGFGGESIEVTVSDGKTVVDRSVLHLDAGTHEYTVHLTLEPREEGTRKYTVSIPSLPGELTTRNNSRSFFIKVLRSKVRVLLVNDSPAPDVASVRQNLSADERFSVTELVSAGSSQPINVRAAAANLDTCDCLILAGFPTAPTDQGLLRAIVDAIGRRHLPVLFINGKQTDYVKLRLLDSALPFTWSAVSRLEIPVTPVIPGNQTVNPLITLEGTTGPAGWAQLPPVYKTQTVFRAKAGAEAIAMARMQNIPLNEPLILTWNIGRQKTFAITGYGIWRWQLLTEGSREGADFLPLLLSNAVRWLTTEEENKFVRITPAKEAFTTAEPVEFTGQVYDDQLRPVDNADVPVTIRRDGAEYRLLLTAAGNGRYEGSIDALPEGEYTFSGTATAGGRSLGEDGGKFSVGQVNIEFLETKMNKSLLDQIAYHTGGMFYANAVPASFPDDLGHAARLSPKEFSEAREIELWNSKYFALLIVLLLAVEWFIRKRNGMI